MLIKGCQKSFVVLKNIGSDYIEEAYLVLKSEVPTAGKKDIVREANLIVRAYETGRKRKRTPFSLPVFFMGVFAACAVWACILLFL